MMGPKLFFREAEPREVLPDLPLGPAIDHPRGSAQDRLGDPSMTTSMDFHWFRAH